MCSVAFGGSARSDSVEVGVERCFPACTRRRSVFEGRACRRARREERVCIVVLEGSVRGIAVGVVSYVCL